MTDPFPHLFIDEFIPSTALVRAAAASFDVVPDENWVKYGEGDNQIQYCSKNRELTPPSALLVLDYIASHFDPNTMFNRLTDNAFPDTSYYGGGMMITPIGGYLGMHVDAKVHSLHPKWVREYSAVLCISEEYNSSFDLLLHDGESSHTKVPYKFNRLNVFKCSENSWHGIPNPTKDFNRKALGVMYWSARAEEIKDAPRAKFNNDLEFK
jgi:hypothetical protein